MGILNWLKRQFREDRAPRYVAPGMVANYWGAGVPQPHPIMDISVTGAYFSDADKWPVGTMMSGVLRCTADGVDESPDHIFRVSFLVVRHGSDGMGVSFLLPTKTERLALRHFLNATSAAGSRKNEPG